MRLATIFFLGLIATAQAAELKPGRASGTYTYDGRTVAIEHAATYIEQIDGQACVVLILSDEEISTAGWDDGADFLKYRMRNPFLGVALWLDENRKIMRAAYFDADGLPYGDDAGLFELKLQDDKPPLKGIAVSTDKAAKLHKPVVLDAEFNAAVPAGANLQE